MWKVVGWDVGLENALFFCKTSELGLPEASLRWGLFPFLRYFRLDQKAKSVW